MIKGKRDRWISEIEDRKGRLRKIGVLVGGEREKDGS